MSRKVHARASHHSPMNKEIIYNHLMFVKPQLHKAKIISKQKLNGKTIQLNIKLISEKPFLFKAGQYINLKIGTKYRAYSIASDPNHTGSFSVVATVAHHGIGANFFKKAHIGSKFEFVGPSGRFVLNDEFPPYLTFVATGTGIVPFVSMFYQIARLQPDSTIRVYFGIRHEEELFFLDKLNEFRQTITDFDYYVCVSQPKHKTKYNRGHVTSYVPLNKNGDMHYYLCGNPNMVEDVEGTLIRQGISNSDIYKEKYKIAGN